MLRDAGLSPLALAAKEGLALINGTQVSTALALHALFTFEPVLEAALVVGALTVDAARGSDGPFDPRIHELRGQPGQIDVAPLLPRAAGGQRDPPLAPAGRRPRPGPVQPALPAAGRRRLPRPAAPRRARPRARGQRGHRQPARLRRRRRRRGSIVSGGNFHAEPVALAADAMAVAIAEVGAIAERRIAMLIDAGVSRLPPFLSAEPGPQQRLHDRPRDRGVAREREQVARPSGERRQPADEREPGRPRLDGDLRRAPPAADDRQHGAHPRDRAARRGAGDRVPAPARELGAARGGARAAAPAVRGDADRPLPRAPTSSAPPRWSGTARWRVSCARFPACRRSGIRRERYALSRKPANRGTLREARHALQLRPFSVDSRDRSSSVAAGVGERRHRAGRSGPRARGRRPRGRESGGLRRERIGYKRQARGRPLRCRAFSAADDGGPGAPVDPKPDFEEDVRPRPRRSPSRRARFAPGEASIDAAVRADATWAASAFDLAQGLEITVFETRMSVEDLDRAVPRLSARTRARVAGRAPAPVAAAATVPLATTASNCRGRRRSCLVRSRSRKESA